MAAVLWNIEHVLMIDHVGQSKTVTHVYCAELIQKMYSDIVDEKR